MKRFSLLRVIIREARVDLRIPGPVPTSTAAQMLHIPQLQDTQPGVFYDHFSNALVPGSSEERARFLMLQERLVRQFKTVFPNPRSPRTVVVIPSLSMDDVVLKKISGVEYYEERMLCLLMLLRLPRTNLVYVTSQPLSPSIIDYYLSLLPGIPAAHARARLTLLSCHDAEAIPLSQKILHRPRLLRRIRAAIPNVEAAHMTCFNATHLERTLAVRLDIPLYACDPDRCFGGTKSSGREVFRAAGILLPDGFENLTSSDDMVEALADLKGRNPDLRRAVVKVEEGASGEGNAVFPFEDAPRGVALQPWIKRYLPQRLRFEASMETWDTYQAKFNELGGIVECYIEGKTKRSPSMQGRIDPLGEPVLVSTHDQVLGGPSSQIFLGCTFPAAPTYRLEVQRLGLLVGSELRKHDVLGRFGVDYVSVPREGGWDHYAIEINIRKGGTTHPFLMLEFLTDGNLDPETGLYVTRTGLTRYYYASDNLMNPIYRGFRPEDLIEIALDHNLHFNSATQGGVVFHLIGALSQFGKLGVVCISDSIEAARKLYLETVYVLDQEALAQEKVRSILYTNAADG